MAELIDGKLVSKKILAEIKEKVLLLNTKNVQPKLVVILVGDNPASLSYIKSKRKACEKTGILWELIRYDDTTTEELLLKIEELNDDPRVHGLLVQLPLPKHVDEDQIIRAIDPSKDVDGFHANNLGKMFLGTEFEDLLPCTPNGIIHLMEYYGIDPAGKEAVVVGKSNIVGKPISTMLLNRRATVTTCHSKTQDLASHTKRADILVVAVGKAGLITEDMVTKDTVVFDVGINRLPNGKLVGDVDFEKVGEKASYITPVPGGCGPMTVACLMENTIKACKALSARLS